MGVFLISLSSNFYWWTEHAHIPQKLFSVFEYVFSFPNFEFFTTTAGNTFFAILEKLTGYAAWQIAVKQIFNMRVVALC